MKIGLSLPLTLEDCHKAKGNNLKKEKKKEKVKLSG